MTANPTVWDVNSHTPKCYSCQFGLKKKNQLLMLTVLEDIKSSHSSWNIISMLSQKHTPCYPSNKIGSNVIHSITVFQTQHISSSNEITLKNYTLCPSALTAFISLHKLFSWISRVVNINLLCTVASLVGNSNLTYQTVPSFLTAPLPNLLSFTLPAST